MCGSREGQHVLRSAPSAPYSTGAGTNVGSHQVLSMPIGVLTYDVEAQAGYDGPSDLQRRWDSSENMSSQGRG